MSNAEMETVFHSVPMKVNITESDLRDLITTAFESGIHYWVQSLEYHLTDGVTIEDFQHRDNSETGEQGKHAPEDYRPTIQNVPFVDGCKVVVVLDEAHEGDKIRYFLDKEAMKRGLELMVTEAPEHFQDFMDENYDAITADVFIQLCLFDEIVYG